MQQAERKLEQGSPNEAAALLRKAISYDADTKTAIRALYKLGYVQETLLRDFEGAVLNFQEFARLSQDKVSRYEVFKRIGNIYFENLNDPQLAAKTYQQVLELSPDSLERDFISFRIGQCHFRMNDFQKAREYYESILVESPKSSLVPRVRFEIGNSFFMAAKYDVAIEALKQVLRNHSGTDYAIEAQFMMAQCLEHLDRFQEAEDLYSSVEDNYPNRQVVQIRLDALRKRIKRAH